MQTWWMSQYCNQKHEFSKKVGELKRLGIITLWRYPFLGRRQKVKVFFFNRNSLLCLAKVSKSCFSMEPETDSCIFLWSDESETRSHSHQWSSCCSRSSQWVSRESCSFQDDLMSCVYICRVAFCMLVLSSVSQGVLFRWYRFLSFIYMYMNNSDDTWSILLCVLLSLLMSVLFHVNIEHLDTRQLCCSFSWNFSNNTMFLLKFALAKYRVISCNIVSTP